MSAAISKCLCDQKASGIVKQERFKLELLMNQAGIALGGARSRKSAPMPPLKPQTASLPPPLSWQTARLSPARPARCWARASAALLNALKKLAGIDQETDLVSARAIEPIQTLKTTYLGSKKPMPSH